MVDWFEFIRKHNVGMEGTSVWIWWDTGEGNWKSVGFAKGTLEESLSTLHDYMIAEGMCK